MRSWEGMYRVRYFPRARSITHLLHARLGYKHFFFHFLLLYLGSKSSPYRVIFDRLSGQYREIWTGLGCRGLASCMTTVTCRVMNKKIKKIKYIYIYITWYLSHYIDHINGDHMSMTWGTCIRGISKHITNLCMRSHCPRTHPCTGMHMIRSSCSKTRWYCMSPGRHHIHECLNGWETR